MIFIDKDTGAEYEAEYMHNLAYEDNLGYAKVYALKPVQLKPKELFWSMWWQPDGEDRPALFSEKITEDQAQLIKEWIEAGMKYLDSPMKDFPNEVAETYNKARQAMRGDK